MNKEHVEQAIAIMKRAGKVDMACWQVANSGKFAETEADLHACGNSACFAGWVAVSPEWQEFGGEVGICGMPIYPHEVGIEDARLGAVRGIAYWLGIRYDLAKSLIHGDEDDDYYSRFYDKPWADVKAPDVIAKLELILSGELQ